jgi:hypothetical protein
MEKTKATHEIVGIGKNSAWYEVRRELRKKRGTFRMSQRHEGSQQYSSDDHCAGWFKLAEPTEDESLIFSCDIKVRELK